MINVECCMMYFNGFKNGALEQIYNKERANFEKVTSFMTKLGRTSNEPILHKVFMKN